MLISGLAGGLAAPQAATAALALTTAGIIFRTRKTKAHNQIHVSRLWKQYAAATWGYATATTVATIWPMDTAYMFSAPIALPFYALIG